MNLIDLSSINLDEYKRTLEKGTFLFRAIPSNANFDRATGQKSRLASEPEGFNRQLYWKGLMAGTGVYYFASNMQTCSSEVGGLTGKDVWSASVIEPFEIIDMDRICGYEKPYITWLDNHQPNLFNEFYGKFIPGLYYESKQNPNGHCLALFDRAYPAFQNCIYLEKLKFGF